jgi:hypothetical protein
MSPTECIWSDNHKASIWRQNPVTFSEQGYRIMYVFDEMDHRDGIKSLIRIVLRGQGAVMDAEPFLSRPFYRFVVKVHTFYIPPQLLHPFQELASATPDIQQAAIGLPA